MKKERIVIIEIRECDWVNGMACKWQGHAYREGGKNEPLISGQPADSPKDAKRLLSFALNEYRSLITDASEAINQNTIKTK